MPRKTTKAEELQTEELTAEESNTKISASEDSTGEEKEIKKPANQSNPKEGNIDPTLSEDNAQALLHAIYGTTDPTSAEFSPVEASYEPNSEEEEPLEEYIEDSDSDETPQKVDEAQVMQLFNQILGIYEKKKSSASISRTQKKELNKKSTILSAANGEIAATLEERKKEELLTLQQAANSRSSNLKFLHGEIVGTRMMEGLNTPVAIVKLDNFDGFFEIIIPASQLYPSYDINKYIMEGGFIDHKAMIRAMKDRIGSKIDFEVLQVDPKGNKAYASRINAMEKNSQHIYMGYGTKNKKPKIDPTDPKNKNIITGRVMKSGISGITVEIGGAEAYIPINEISYERIETVADLYVPGDTVPVKVLEVSPYQKKINNRAYTFFNVTASIKQASARKSELYEGMYHVGDIRKGIITGISMKGNYIVNVADQIEVVCPAPTYGMPCKGDSVQISIYSKYVVDGVTRFYGYFARC